MTLLCLFITAQFINIWEDNVRILALTHRTPKAEHSLKNTDIRIPMTLCHFFFILCVFNLKLYFLKIVYKFIPGEISYNQKHFCYFRNSF